MNPGGPLIGVTCGTSSTAAQHPRYGTNQVYTRAIAEAGGVPVLLVPDAAGRTAGILDRLDGLLIPGGADVDPSFYGAERSELCGPSDRARDALELECLAGARERALPVLGICRGMQVINVAFGGTLHQDIAAEVPRALRHRTPPELGRDHLEHDIAVAPGSWFAEASGATALLVNSLHHQAVNDVGEGLVVTARSEDGLVEGLETADRQTVAIQCHTEELPGLEWAQRTFASFVRTAAGRASAVAGTTQRHLPKG